MKVTDQPLRVPEVARRLGLDGPVVYDLIASGELVAGKGTDGLVYVRESALEEYQRRHAATTP
ncbi:MAG: helix-turn-helix domain-containing protein [Acidimicrobiales bacterium]